MKKSKKAKYVFIDTNVFINCCLTSQNKEDVDVLTILENRISNNSIILLLPELIQAEFYRIIDDRHSRLNQNLDAAEKKMLDIFPDHPRVQGVVNTFFQDKKLKKQLAGIKKEISENFDKAKAVVKRIFESKKVFKIPVTNDILLSAYKRGVFGRKPYKQIVVDLKGASIQSDCIHFESVKEYIKNKDDIELIICSADKNDYCERDGRVAEDIQSEMKYAVRIYHELHKLLNKEFSTNINKDKLSISKIFEQYPSFAGDAMLNCVYCGGLHPTEVCPSSLSIGTISSLCDRCGSPHPFSICPNIVSVASYVLGAVQEYCRSCQLSLQGSVLSIDGLCLTCQQGTRSMVCDGCKLPQSTPLLMIGGFCSDCLRKPRCISCDRPFQPSTTFLNMSKCPDCNSKQKYDQ